MLIRVGVLGFRLGLRLVQVLCQPMTCDMLRCSGFREIVIKCVLLCGCVGLGIGIGVRVEWVLPRRVRDVVRRAAGVFFLEVSL